MKKNYNIHILLIINIFIITSCGTITKSIETEKKFTFKDAGIFESKRAFSKLSLKVNYKGKIWAELTSPFLHWSTISGKIISNESGDYEFYIEYFKYITNWGNGFTLGENEASGKIIFQKTKNGWTAKIDDPFELWEMKKGEIRYFDDYYVGEEGLKKVKNRMNRIKALNAFLKENKFPEFFGNPWLKTSYGESFSKVAKKFLLNKSTQYPEHLIKLKESGTVKRDLEEALGLFFMDYNMKYYFNNILNNSIFIEKEK